MPKPSKPSSRPLKDEGVSSPLRQHHLLALGERKNGSTDPYGAATPSTENRIGNSQGKTH